MRVTRPILLVVVLLLAAPTRSASAWNPLESLARGGRAVGQVLGAPIGGLVEAATTPTMRNLEDSSHRVIRHADAAIGRQLDHAGRITSGVIAQTNRAMADRLDQADQSIKARIVQVETAANAGVDRAFGRLDQSVGRLDHVARARIAQLREAGKDAIKDATQAAKDLLADADEILRQRTAELRELVESAIALADLAIEARLEQLDEIAGRRLGNIDVIATKQSLSLERMLLRIAALIGMLGFIAFVLWRLFDEAGKAWKAALSVSSVPRRVVAVLWRGSPRFIVQVLMAAGGVWLLYSLSDCLPRGATERAAQQISVHRVELNAALAAYDFTNVRYHAAQLELLVPEESARLRGVAGKAALLRTVFARPGRLRQLDGIRALIAEINEVERQLGADPDLMVIKAYVQWQIGTERSDELAAASLCADALQAPPSEVPGGFLLAPLARNYLRVFLHDPYLPVTAEPALGVELARLRAVLAANPDQGEFPPLQHMFELNGLIAQLDRASTQGYLAMLAAHAEYRLLRTGQPPRTRTESMEVRAARERRNAEAAKVVEAWRSFDESLATSPWLIDDASALRAFTLDDAVLTHALYYVAMPAATELAPLLSAPDGKLDPRLRLEIAPLRVAWEDRYLHLIGLRARDLLSYEESARFRGFELRDREFESAYVDFLVASQGGPLPAGKDLTTLAATAAAAAARIGLYRDTPSDRVTEASVIAEQLVTAGRPPFTAAQLAAHAQAYQRRRLAFL